jgi:hypothetical protein
MTKFHEMPLRPQGQPWPGLNTRGGRLDPGMGQLEDGSFNAVINEADILEKRKGLVRGLDERFEGPVCGLFRYTDDCGVEYLVVADQEGVKVRTPFDVPTFLGSDSLPNDGFTSLDTTRWTNTDDYTIFLGSLVLVSTALPLSSVETNRLMQWFKESVLASYFAEIQYHLVAESSQRQQVAVAIKRVVDSYLIARVTLVGSDYSFSLEIVESGSSTTLASGALQGALLAEGFLRISYSATTMTVTIRVVPSGGSQVTADAVLSEAQDNNLGQNTALGIAVDGQDQPEILQITSAGL